MARVVIENLSKNFKGPAGETVQALHDFSLVLRDQEFIVLLGPSGCGKTTTLRLIAGLEEVSTGSISIDGQVINDTAPKDRDIAMVFQNYALYPHMTVYENMALGLKLRKVPKPEIEQRVRETSDFLGLVPFLFRKPYALSGGERQRVALGRAMVRHPKVFLFDEPLSNLDPQMRHQLRTEISKLHRRLQATMIYVTHDQAEAMTMGNRIVVLDHGRIQQVADPLMLYRAPANVFVAGFIGSPAMNFFRGTLLQNNKNSGLVFVEENRAGEGEALTLPLSTDHAASLQDYVGRPVILGLRPEHIQPVSNTPTANPLLTANVEAVEPIGPEMHVYFRTGDHSIISRISAREDISAGSSITLSVDMQHAHLFDAASGTTLWPPKSTLT